MMESAWQCPTLAEQRARMIACETNDRITRLATLTVSFCSGRWIERNVSGHCRDVRYRGCTPEFGYAVRLVLEPLRERHLQSASIETCPAGSHHPHPLSTARLISFCDSPRPAAAVDPPRAAGFLRMKHFYWRARQKRNTIQLQAHRFKALPVRRRRMYVA